MLGVGGPYFADLVEVSDKAAVRSDERASTPFTEGGQPVTLQVVLFRPPEEGRYPTLVFNHGSTGDGTDPSQFGLTFTSKPIAAYSADRG